MTLDFSDRLLCVDKLVRCPEELICSRPCKAFSNGSPARVKCASTQPRTDRPKFRGASQGVVRHLGRSAVEIGISSFRLQSGAHFAHWKRCGSSNCSFDGFYSGSRDVRAQTADVLLLFPPRKRRPEGRSGGRHRVPVGRHRSRSHDPAEAPGAQRSQRLERFIFDQLQLLAKIRAHTWARCSPHF